MTLTAIGPLPEAPAVALGDRVSCWAGVGVLERIGPPFNGVQGIHAYVSVRLPDGGTCAEMLDRLTPAPLEDGWLW